MNVRDTPESIAKDFVDGHMAETHDEDTREAIKAGLARWIHALVRSTWAELVARAQASESRERSLREALEKARERLRHCDRGHDDRFIDAALFLSPAPQQEGAKG